MCCCAQEKALSSSKEVLALQHLVARRWACDRQPGRRPGCATAYGVTSSRAGGESRDRGAAAALREARLCMHPPIAGSHPKSR